MTMPNTESQGTAREQIREVKDQVVGQARTCASLLGYSEAARLLEQNLQEEEAADKKLTQLGEGGINEAAAMAGAGVEEE